MFIRTEWIDLVWGLLVKIEAISSEIVDAVNRICKRHGVFVGGLPLSVSLDKSNIAIAVQICAYPIEFLYKDNHERLFLISESGICPGQKVDISGQGIYSYFGIDELSVEMPHYFRSSDGRGLYLRTEDFSSLNK